MAATSTWSACRWRDSAESCRRWAGPANRKAPLTERLSFSFFVVCFLVSGCVGWLLLLVADIARGFVLLLVDLRLLAGSKLAAVNGAIRRDLMPRCDLAD